jgi:hypothetical protein
MKVLWASAHLPDPGRGGGWALEYELLRYAVSAHDITLVSGELGAGEAVPPILAELGIDIRGVARPPRAVPGRTRLLWLLAQGSTPLGAWVAEPITQSLIEAVVGVEEAQEVDLVHVMPQEAAPVVAAARAPTALYLGDGYWPQLSRELSLARWPKDRLRISLDRRNARRWEGRWYRRADAVACVSQADADALSAVYGLPVGVVPLAIGDEWFVEPAVPRRGRLVTFVGNLSFEPNVDAVVWFADEVWPFVSRHQPSARFRVVGRDPNAEVKAAVARVGGELLANVADVRPHYWESSVVVAPIRRGSGVKNKVLHAAACRAPQVGTAFAFYGTGAVAGEHVLTAEAPEDLAAATIACLTDPVSANDRASRAVRLAEGHRTAGAGAALDALWARALAPTGSPAVGP